MFCALLSPVLTLVWFLLKLKQKNIARQAHMLNSRLKNLKYARTTCTVYPFPVPHPFLFSHSLPASSWTHSVFTSHQEHSTKPSKTSLRTPILSEVPLEFRVISKKKIYFWRMQLCWQTKNLSWLFQGSTCKTSISFVLTSSSWWWSVHH